jgi:hypothetical protein
MPSELEYIEQDVQRYLEYIEQDVQRYFAMSEVERNRQIWINRLFTTTEFQGPNSLCSQALDVYDQPMFYDENNDVPVPAYCCLGIACISVPTLHNRWQGMDIGMPVLDENGQAYSYNWTVLPEWAMKELDLSEKMMQYLMAMNDGSDYPAIVDAGGLDEGRKKIRHTNESRSFHFIARFLQIAWRMTPASHTTENFRNSPF